MTGGHGLTRRRWVAAAAAVLTAAVLVGVEAAPVRADANTESLLFATDGADGTASTFYRINPEFGFVESTIGATCPLFCRRSGRSRLRGGLGA